MGKVYSEFIDRLRLAVQEHEERILRLEEGIEKAFRRSRSGEKEDISLQTADHYRRLAHHLREIISRHDLKNAQKSEPEIQENVAQPRRTERR
jgi:hypothetical protein